MSANEISKGETFDTSIFPLNLDFWYVYKFISEQKNGYHNILLSGNLLQEDKIGTKEYITPIPNR